MKAKKNNFDISELEEFDNHKLLNFIHDDKGKLCGYIAIHRGSLEIPAFGATRYWKYSSPTEALRDALRLARLMSYKSAMAGLKYGGAKATLMENGNSKKGIITSYTKNVTYLGGRFITGADVGISTSDVQFMHKNSPYIVGAIGDPVRFTAQGIVEGLQASLKGVFDTDTFDGRSFAIQGVGKIGTELLKHLYESSKVIYVADINQARIKQIITEYPRLVPVSVADIHKQKVDVFMPCALSGIINSTTIKELRCKIIAGGANNQLENALAGEKLHQRGILYAPDYLINAGGLISVVDEYEYKNFDAKRVESRVSKIGDSMRAVLSESKRKNSPTNFVADAIAKKKIEETF